MSQEKEKVFRYSRADFGPLKFVPLHYDLDFDFPLESTDIKVTSRQTYINKTDKESNTILLDAHDLKLESIQFSVPPTPLGDPPVGISAKVPDFVSHVKELDGLTFNDVKYDYDTDKRIITVTLPEGVAPGKEFTLRTVSVASPDDKTLEGMYYDYTPKGQPQTIISQCQQYGFQRIVPCIDTMTGKTFYTTRITANNKYTNIVSNGDLVGEYVAVEDGARKTATYYNHKVNMAPYLFFIGVGTYETYKSEVEYATGQTFDVEILALPGVIDKKEDALSALQSMVNSIVWMQLSTGPEKYEHEEERKQAYALIQERDELKASGKDAEKLAGVREKLKELMKAWKETGYVYTGSCYREIGMQNSNYGGMENVGNTTILSSRLTPSKWLVDGGHVYMEGVKIHEFYHNINGSQVTGTSPFEIWLNEAVTVHVQREREYDIFGHDYMRLGHVIYARMPGTGPLALDRAPSSMAVEPEGFNTTHELVSAMAYSKAPEYVKMTETLIGKENFVKALSNYHTKYAFSNATSGEWVDEMAVYQPEGVDLRKMAHGWLKRTGYPIVTVTDQKINGGEVKVELTQTGFEEKTDDNSPWIIPIVYSAVKDGKSVASGVWVLQTPTQTFEINELSTTPDFISIGCDWSFYGEVNDKSSTVEQRFLQAKSDPDTINRYLAFQAILDDEKFNLVSAYRDGDKDGLVAVSEGVVDLYGSVLNDDNLSEATKGRFLGIGSSCPSRPEVSHYYWALSYAQKSILKAVGKKYIKELLNIWEKTTKDSSLNNRSLKFAVFSAIRASGEVEGEALKEMVRPLLEANNMSDRGFALRVLLELGEKEAQEVAKKAWVGHTIGCEQYIATVSTVDADNTPQLIRELIKEPFFELALAGHARTCARAWCGNLKRALLTKEGLELTKDLFLAVGKVNQMSAYGFIGTFSQANKFETPVKNVLIGALKDMRSNLDPKAQESLYSQTGRLLSGLE